MGLSRERTRSGALDGSKSYRFERGRGNSVLLVIPASNRIVRFGREELPVVKTTPADLLYDVLAGLFGTAKVGRHRGRSAFVR